MAHISEDGFNKEKDLEKISKKVVFQPFCIQKMRLFFFLAKILIHGVRKRGDININKEHFHVYFFSVTIMFKYYLT